MLRKLVTTLLAALLLVPEVGSALGTPDLSSSIRLQGRLEYVTTLSSPHYEVQGYVLLYKDPSKLVTLAGQDVYVVGTESTAPSIYMRKTIEVSDIGPRKGAPDPDDGLVKVPVMPGPVLPEPVLPEPIPVTPAPSPVPAPAPGGGFVTIPEPTPLFGTPYSVLFGRITYTGKEYLAVQERIGGDAQIPIASTAVNLAELVGQQVGLVVMREHGTTGICCYQVIAVLSLTGDIGHLLGDGLIYNRPQQPITVRVRGEAVAMDQAPILGNGRTMVGLRAVAEAMGATVGWEQETGTVTVSLGSRDVIVRIGTNEVVVREHGQVVSVIDSDVAPAIAGGRTMVPVRVVAESLGLVVGWEAANWTVTLD